MATYNSYHSLKGNVLQKDDIIIFEPHVTGYVTYASAERWYVAMNGHLNHYIFEKLKIAQRQFFSLNASGDSGQLSGGFPEHTTPNHLTKTVLAIFANIEKIDIKYPIAISDYFKRIINKYKDQNLVFKTLEYAYKEGITGLPVINFLDVLEGGHISFFNSNKIMSCGFGHHFNSYSRQTAKPNVAIKKILKEFVIHDAEYEKFANILKAESAINNLFEIVEGADIKKYYHQNTYETKEHTGSLAASCMRYAGCQKQFNLYVKNPHIIKMLILKSSEDKIKGRALLWHYQGHKIMDRVYASDSVIKSFHKWANENDYMYRHTGGQRYHFIKNGEVVEHKIKITGLLLLHKWYPYLDTFIWGKNLTHLLDSKAGYLANYEVSRYHDITFTNTSGEAYAHIDLPKETLEDVIGSQHPAEEFMCQYSKKMAPIKSRVIVQTSKGQTKEVHSKYAHLYTSVIHQG